jgi:hypothetical protein
MYEGLRTNLSAFYAKRTQSPKTPKITATPVIRRGYNNIPGFASPKTKPKRTQTNPNEPKATPIFRPKMAPKAKTNPNEPNLVRLRRIRKQKNAPAFDDYRPAQNEPQTSVLFTIRPGGQRLSAGKRELHLRIGPKSHFFSGLGENSPII